MKRKGKAYLIGAGCANYDLITLRAAAVLKESTAVIYDNLIDKRLLSLCKKDALKIYAGKRSGAHSHTQSEINELLTGLALDGHIVARLKGGDPFVFGRGGEEAKALRAHDIEYAVIPGVTSAVAVPEFSGIPVTHRGLSRSFHVISGNTMDDLPPEKLSLYAKLDGTLVFLMGLSNLGTIAEKLIKSGAAPSTPSAVISGGGTSRQKTVKSTLGKIARDVKKENLSTPAVIVIGETAGLELYPSDLFPLAGKTVAVSGTDGFCRNVRSKAEVLGAFTVKAAGLKPVYLYENALFSDALSDLTKYSAAVFTSANGAEAFFSMLKKSRTDLRTLFQLRFAAIGEKTAKAVERHGIYPELVCASAASEELGRLLCRSFSPDDKLLLLRARCASDELTKILDKSDMNYTDIALYDVKDCAGDSENAVSADYYAFGSGSSVRSFLEGGNAIAKGAKCVCMGKSAQKALEDCGISEILVSETPCADGIIKTILEDTDHEKIQTAESQS